MTPLQMFKGTLVVLATLLGAYVLITSIEVLIVLLIAIIVASAVRSIIDRLVKWHVPRGVAIGAVYFVLISGLLLMIIAVLPPVMNQVTLYFGNEGRLTSRIVQAQRVIESLIGGMTNSDISLVNREQIDTAVTGFLASIQLLVPNLVNDLGGILGNTVLIFVIGAYWLTSHHKATAFMTQLFELRYREQAQQVILEIENAMGAYVRGVLITSVLVGLLNFIPMQLLGVPNALTFALIIGVLTAIPMVGGLLGGVIATLLTLLAAPEYIVTVAAIAFIVQQIESYVITPRVMSNRLDLDPLLIIVYSAIGFSLFGVVGALIAVPVMGSLHILLMVMVIKPHQENIRTFDMQDGLPLVRIHEPNTIPPGQPLEKVGM